MDSCTTKTIKSLLNKSFLAAATALSLHVVVLAVGGSQHIGVEVKEYNSWCCSKPGSPRERFGIFTIQMALAGHDCVTNAAFSSVGTRVETLMTLWQVELTQAMWPPHGRTTGSFCATTAKVETQGSSRCATHRPHAPAVDEQESLMSNIIRHENLSTKLSGTSISWSLPMVVSCQLNVGAQPEMVPSGSVGGLSG